ncbi:MAG TPA: hypothetical protein VNP98_17060 [Chthoniobacterales bacterium]|nr:hypothetical protein [Chthoniobacterales bacterium]
MLFSELALEIIYTRSVFFKDGEIHVTKVTLPIELDDTVMRDEIPRLLVLVEYLIKIEANRFTKRNTCFLQDVDNQVTGNVFAIRKLLHAAGVPASGFID